MRTMKKAEIQPEFGNGMARHNQVHLYSVLHSVSVNVKYENNMENP